jgi:hypothetical protein
MNLVKAQEYAQSLPIPDLQKYVDGMNPAMIPPWVATGVMQAKTKQAEMANAMQGAAQGEQPSVKEQIEQKAGLLGLQMAQQRNTQQQMMQPRPMAGPVPTGTPQPRPQPQPQSPFPQMAGLNQLQSNIKMAGGGIVAFAGKGPSKVVNPDAGFWDWLSATSGLSKEEFIAAPQKTKNNILEMFRSSEGVAPPPSAQAAQATQAAQGAQSGAFQAGQKTAGAINAAKNIAKTKLLPGANVGLAAYEGLSDISSAKDFYDDPNVPMSEKAKQFARTGARTALPIAGGAAGSLAAPVAGTIAGAAAGTGLAALIDQEGDALKKYRALQASGQNNQSAAETARLNATAPASAMGNEGRRAGPVATGNGINVSPNLIPASAKPKPQGNVPQNVNPNAVKVNPNAPAAPAESAAPAPDSMDALFREAIKKESPQRSVESLIAEDQDIKKRLGLDEPAGKNKLERIADIKQQYAATQLSPMDELIAMLGKSGQSKGLSGLAPAYTSMAAKKRAADLAHAERINELMGGVEDTQRGEKTASATGVRTAREKDVENARLRDREVLSSTGTARGQDIQAGSSKYSADMHYKAAMAQIRSTAAREGMQQQRLLLDTFKTELATIDRELAPLLKAPFGPAKAQIAELQARKAGLTKALDEASGISKMMPAPGAAASPGGTRPPLSSFQR